MDKHSNIPRIRAKIQRMSCSLAQFFFLALLSACTEHQSSTPLTDRQHAKELYKQIIRLRFEKPDEALALADSILQMNQRQALDTFALVAIVQKSLILSEKRQMSEAVLLARKALESWKPSDGIFAKCKALEQMGQCYIVLMDYTEAKSYFEQELALAPECGEKADGIESFAASYLGDVAEKQGKWEESIQFHQRAVDAALRNGGADLVAGAYHSMSIVFHTIGDYTQEMDCLKKASVNFEESDYRRAASYLNIAELFSTLKMPDSANIYLKKAYNMKDTPPVIRLVSMVGYGGVLTDEKQYDDARQLMQDAILLADTIDDKERMAIALNQIGETYTAEKKYTIALRYSVLADSVLRDSQTVANFNTRYDAARNIVKNQLLADDRPLVAANLEDLGIYRDSISRAEFLEVMNNYQNKIKSDSIALLTSGNRLQSAQLKISNLLLLLLGAGSLLLGGLAYALRRNLLLSRENLGILGEQNQRLQHDNQSLKLTLEQIRQTEVSDKTKMLEQFITLPTRNNLSLKLSDIQYVQAFGGGVYYVTIDKRHLVWHGFDESLQMLPNEFFVKTHRSYIVNKIFVEQVSPRKVFLKNGEEIPIGVTMKDEVIERLDWGRS